MKTFVSLAVLALIATADAKSVRPVTLKSELDKKSLILEGGEGETAEGETAEGETTEGETTEVAAEGEGEAEADGEAAAEAEGGNTGLIIGGVVGGLALVGGLVYWKKSSDSEGGEYERLL